MDDTAKQLTSLKQKLKSVSDEESLDSLRIEYLGRNGRINKLFYKLKSLSVKEKKKQGPEINQFKQTVEHLIENKKEKILSQEPDYSKIDITLPGVKKPLGQLHPHTFVRNQMNQIFKQLGFSVAEGPHIDTDEYIFERTNLPKHHPARALQDSIVVEDPEILLRTQTSSVESHILEENDPPLRIVIPGMCFRNETPNATNHFIFHQYQGLALGEDITMADLKGTFEYFAKEFFGNDSVIRFRSKYYPEVEPGCGMDLQCRFCKGKGCQVCKYRGWVEIGGGGMRHPNMLEAAGIDHKKYSAFAFGWGFDRIVMQKLGINDIRHLYDGSLSNTL